MRIRYALTLASLTGVLAQACNDQPAEPAGAPPTEVTESAASAKTRAAQPKTYPTVIAQPRDVARPLRITGRVVPLQEATVASQVPGIVLPTDKLLQEGKFYRKGETMVAIDDESLRLSLRASRAEFASAMVRLLPTLRNDHRRHYPAYKAFVDGIDPTRTLPSLPKPATDTLRYLLASNGIDAQYYRIKAQASTLDDYIVRAPFSGKLTRASVEPGSYVAPGAPLATLSRTDVYEVRASVPADAADRLRPGQKIELRNRNLGTSYTGAVNRFGTGIDEATQTVTAFVRVSGKGLRSGLYLEGELAGESLDDVTELPKQALRRDGNVYVVRDGTVQLTPVEVAAIEAENVYVRGLPAGTRVITGGVQGEIVGTAAR